MMDTYLRQSLEALGLPVIEPEPEVVAADLARIRARSLAHIIANLLNEHEPLLRASACDATVKVRGPDTVMSFTIGETK